mgnify:CR=1 FL=1
MSVIRNHKVNEVKYKNTYISKLFKNQNDEDFFKSSSEDISNSISFQKEIKNFEEKEKIYNEKNDNKILMLNNRNNEKLSDSNIGKNSSKKINISNKYNEEDEKYNNNNINIYYKVTEKENILNNNIEELDYNGKKNNLNIKQIPIKLNNNISRNNYFGSNNSKNNNLSNEDDSIPHKEYDDKKNKLKFEDSSFCSSSQNKSNDKNDLENGISNIKENEMDINIVNLHKRNTINKLIFNGKRLSTTARTTSRFLTQKQQPKNAGFIRKKSKRISQKEFSINSSISSNYNKQKEINIFKNFIIKKLLNYFILMIMIIFNLFSLLSNDIKHIWLPKKVDIYFDIFNFISILYFILEIIAICILEDEYLISFLFWIDVIGAIMILFDIEIISNPIFKYNTLDTYKMSNTLEYIHVCIIIFERVIRSIKFLRCYQLYKLIEAIKKFIYIYNEKQQRDLVKEEYQKQKLMQKIHNIEGDDEDEIEESICSNESNLQTKNTSNINEVIDEEDNENNIERRSIRKKRSTITGTHIHTIQQIAKIREIRRNPTSKKINRYMSRKSLRELRQSVKNVRESIFNFDDEEKKEEEDKKIKEKIEEEIYQKIDDFVKNTKITNKVKYSMRTKLIIIFIIILLICIVFTEEAFPNYKNSIMAFSYTFECMINYPYQGHNTSNNKLQNFLLSIKESNFPIINITDKNGLLYENDNLATLQYRYCELVNITYNYNGRNNSSSQIKILYSSKRENNIKHSLYLIITLISCISIVIASYLSGNDLEKILLNPFEVMIEVGEKVSKDPMNAKNIDELKQEIIALLQKNEQNIDEDIHKKYNECYNSYEVKVIMNAIIKISALLAMSVGEAGGEIIHKNLSQKSGLLHFHSKGKKKVAIFGFCNIRNFEEINIALEEKTIPLINQIAEIVHTSVDRFRGNTNKNIGDSFLNVWKFYNNLNIKNNNKKIRKDNLLEIDPLNPQINITADCSVLAYLRCILKINKNLNLLKYRKNKKLNRIIPNFKINMGFGLHLGYGIEGPVGSIFKMEASYLSPNVNIAARLETATKQFGVNILISGKLYNLFTEEIKSICRYVDRVVVKGSTEPIDLYTIDINYDDILPQKKEKIQIFKTPEDKAKFLKEKKVLIESLIEEYGSISPIILEKKSYFQLIDEKSERFYDGWDNAMALYKEGKWEEAKKYFEECLEEDSNDGPANTLYKYIKQFNFKSPKNWKGERELISK